MTYSLDTMINIAILVLLAVMIVYCIILNKRLKAFNNIKQEMAAIIGQLNASTSHAQKSISEFKNVVLQEQKKIDIKLREAAEIADELDMINQTGSNLADRIEKGLTGNKTPQAEESPSVIDEQRDASARISLSDLDEQSGDDDDSRNLQESLRNVR